MSDDPPPPIEVTLSATEMEIAALVACKRNIQNLILGRKDAHGASRENCWQLNIDGALGEMAVAQWRDKYWTGNLGNLKAADVGSLEVRTSLRDDARLILHKDSPDNRCFILVTGVGPVFMLRGWIWAREGKRSEFWCDPTSQGRAAFFVPQSVLRPMVKA